MHQLHKVVEMPEPIHVLPLLSDRHEERPWGSFNGLDDIPRRILGGPLEGQAQCVGMRQPDWVDQHALCNIYHNVTHGSDAVCQPKLGSKELLGARFKGVGVTCGNCLIHRPYRTASPSEW